MEENKDLPVYVDKSPIKCNVTKSHKIYVVELFLDYANNSTLHGLRYIAERGLTVIEKVFWTLTFLVSVAMCCLLIQNVWRKWNDSPVIVSFSEQLVPVGMVPFPSVTICPQIKCKSSVYSFSEHYRKYIYDILNSPYNETTNNDTLAHEIYEDVSLICDPRSPSLKSDRELGNASVVAHIDEVSPTASDVFVDCKWRDKKFECEKEFKRVLTNEGVCYNFNALAANEIFNPDSIQKEYTYIDSINPSKGWTVDKGFSKDDIDPYPRRGRENGPTPDLVILLREREKEKDRMCNNLNSGFKIYVQHPTDLQRTSLYYYAVLPNQVTSLALKFNMITTLNSLKYYTPEVRQCFFPDDRHLRYFKIYTADNCRLECQSNYTYEMCGCVAYYMPHDNSKDICVKNKYQCVNDAINKLATEEMKADLGHTSGACRCLQACNSVQYEADILKTQYNFHSAYDGFMNILQSANSSNTSNSSLWNLLNADVPHYSQVEMYFKEPRFVSMRRSELFGLTDFLANCGGLLGLFLGFSFLSLVEIIYFLTLRLGCTLKRDLQQKKVERKE